MPTKARPKSKKTTEPKKVKVIKAETKEVKVVEVKTKATQPKSITEVSPPPKPETRPKLKAKPKKATVPPPAPETSPTEPVQGKKYIFTSGAGEFIASINGKNDLGYDLMTIHEIVGGCQSDRTIPIPDISAFTFVDDKDEVFRRLSGN